MFYFKGEMKRLDDDDGGRGDGGMYGSLWWEFGVRRENQRESGQWRY